MEKTPRGQFYFAGMTDDRLLAFMEDKYLEACAARNDAMVNSFWVMKNYHAPLRPADRQLLIDTMLDYFLNEISSPLPASDSREEESKMGKACSTVPPTSDHNDEAAEAGKEADGNSPCGYRFPASEHFESLLRQAKLLSDDKLIKSLDALKNSASHKTGFKPRYVDIRDAVCAISRELNSRQYVAPRFREMRRPPPSPPSAKLIEEDMSNLSNDRQVIDLHWLFCQGIKPNTDNTRYNKLFNVTEFDFQLASELAATTGSVYTIKTTILNLTDFDMWQLSTIQSKAMMGRYSEIKKGRKDSSGKVIRRGETEIRKMLRNAAVNQPQLTPEVIDDFVDLWICQKMVGDSPAVIGKMFALATGKKRDRSTISRKLKNLNEWIKS